MENVINELQAITQEFSSRIGGISEDDMKTRSRPGKWSRQEVLGHLVDSAQNNLRRFICAQYETEPPVITYRQDFWVAANDYQSMETADLIRLWALMNLRICAVLKQMPAENYQCICEANGRYSLLWLAEDYVRHLKHHLNQIISDSFNVLYISR